MSIEIEEDRRIPVTVLTGFLGSGKTTLLNRILTEEHGHRIAVIENEFGEIGIDNELVIDAEEEIFEMNNGCICCTVRGDLIRILGRLVQRREKFERILVETTGLADPGPVAQTFFVDDELASKFRLDGIVTLVDAGHINLHLEDSPECSEQIAFADAIILNKTDLLEDEIALKELEKRLQSINPMATFHRAVNAEVPVDELLNLGGFNLDRALSMNPKFLEPEYPFEWGGTAALKEGDYRFQFQPGADKSINAVVLETAASPTLKAHQEQAVLLFSDDEISVEAGEYFLPSPTLKRIHLSLGQSTDVLLRVPKTGIYAFFLEHFPEEFELLIHREGDEEDVVQWESDRAYIDDHEHDDTVGSVGLQIDGELHPTLLNEWMMKFLSTRGPDIFRMKGVLNIAGQSDRYVFQGVHMLFDAKPQRPWGPDEKRSNEMVFIGRNLDRATLEEGFRKCLA